MDIHGDVAPGFEPVREAFATYADLGDGGAAYAAYHRGELVVDLWAGQAGDEPWRRETRGTWMSVGKFIAATCMAMLVDRGQLDIDEPVVAYWPEFGGNGKGGITVRQVLTHRAGVVGDPRLTALIDLDTGEGIDRTGDILRILADAAPAWEPGTATGYHAHTYSWILGEVLRRIDGRTLGTFLREEIVLPLGVADVRVGTPVEEHHLIAPMHHTLFSETFPEAALQLWRTVFEAAKDPRSPSGLSFFGTGDVSVLDRLPQVYDSVPGRLAEIAGSNMTGTARGVARIAAALAEPDGLDGVRLLGKETLDAFSEVQTRDVDVVLTVPVAKAVGYWRNEQLIEGRPRAFGSNEEAIGHTGMGGQTAFADPVDRVGVAMVRSHHTTFPLSMVMLNTALYECLGG